MTPTTATVNGVELAYELRGDGPTAIVLVHGSWGSRHAWDQVAPALAERYRVLTYDRRGHSDSERPPGHGSVHEDAADLGALIEHLDLEPAYVAGTSFGAIVTLRLACERPHLFRGLIAHEPPLMALLGENRERSPSGSGPKEAIARVIALIDAGDNETAAELFVDAVAFGPGSWARFPEPLRRTFTFNAPTFADEQRDPEAMTMDLEPLGRFDTPVFLSLGDRSPPMFAPIVDIVARRLPDVEVHTFAGAGHGPHNSHPADYIEAVRAFVERTRG